MMNFKFLILALGLTLAQGVLAVTLPTTSYTPHSSGDSYASESVYGGGSLISGSFSVLGTDVDVCVGSAPDVPSGGYASCEDCCDNYFPDESQSDDYLKCVNACEGGPSLPLSAPLWFALLLPLLGGVLKPLLRRCR